MGRYNIEFFMQENRPLSSRANWQSLPSRKTGFHMWLLIAFPLVLGLCLTNPEDFDFIDTLQRYAETCWIPAQKELVEDLVFKFRFQLLCSTALILTFNFPRKSNMHSQFCDTSYLMKNSYWQQLRVLFLITLFPPLWAVCFHKVRVRAERDPEKYLLLLLFSC